MQVGDRFNPYKLFVGSFIPNAIMRNKRLSSGAKICYARLAQYAGENGIAYPSHATLAKEIGVSKRSVINYIHELRDQGFIRVLTRFNEEKKEYESNIYEFLWHESLDDSLREPPGANPAQPLCNSCTTPDANFAHKENQYKENQLREKHTCENHAVSINEGDDQLIDHLRKPSKRKRENKDPTSNPDRVAEKVLSRSRYNIESRARKQPSNSNTIVSLFAEKFKEYFGGTAPVELQKDRSLIKKMIDHYGYEYVETMLVWMFKNWAQFRREKKITGVPTLGIFWGFRNYFQEQVMSEVEKTDDDSEW